VSNKKKEKQLQEAMDDLFRYTLIMGIKFNWQIIAATLVTIGLRLYKTVLDDEGFENMTNTITESYKDIEPYQDEALPDLKNETMH
jgi:hypothetical protein